MNTSRFSKLMKLPMRLWRRFQYARAMVLYGHATDLAEKSRRLTAKADRLIGKNVKPPMPLFDRLEDSDIHR